jgi:hypothetical protein
MSTIEFEADNAPSSRASSKAQWGFVTKFFIAASGGFIKTKQQANIAQIIFIVLALGLFFTFFMGESNTVQAPPQDLINAKQPTKPL